MSNRAKDASSALGIVAVALLCLPCLLVALATGGALAAAGGFLRNPIVIAAGVALVAAGIVAALRHRSIPGHEDCCAPSSEHPNRRRGHHDATR
jgi:hypothetical protein